jgi:hypothetical protein
VNTELLRPLVKELATKINRSINIPFVNEDQEQAFFEMILLMVLDTLLGQLDKEIRKKLD